MRAKDAVGQYGEDLAARYLRDTGYEIVERNWRCALGEVDIVAWEARSSTLVICEVKTRRGMEYGGPLEAVTWRKLARLRTLAAQWLRDHDLTPAEIRIDVVGVVRPRRGPAVIEHLEGVA